MSPAPPDPTSPVRTDPVSTGPAGADPAGAGPVGADVLPPGTYRPLSDAVPVPAPGGEDLPAVVSRTTTEALALLTASSSAGARRQQPPGVSRVRAEVTPGPRPRLLPGEPAGSHLRVTAVRAHRQGWNDVDVAMVLTPQASSASTRIEFTAQLPGASPHPLWDPGSPAWRTAFAEALGRDPEFARLTAHHDGSIGWEIGGRPVHVRVHRGTLLEVVPRTVHGADFTLAMSAPEFTALMSSPREDFMERSMLGRFTSVGSGYEYLRSTGALTRMVTVARHLALESGWERTPA